MFKIKTIFFISAFLIIIKTNSQTILNGDFELNSSGFDQLNLPNQLYNSHMYYSVAFGNKGNMDILTSDTFCGLAQHGKWYVALTGGGSDAISLELSQALTAGATYSISFYDRICRPVTITPYPIQIGLSNVANEFGVVMLTAPMPGENWTLRNFTFIAPGNSNYITITVEKGDSYNSWCHVDNFSIVKCNFSVSLGNDTILATGNTIKLNAYTPNATYTWQDGSVNADFLVNFPGVYWVAVSNNVCTITDTIKIDFAESAGIHVPNAFTPNNDGLNDSFKLLGTVKQVSMKIYNRWGKLLFASNAAFDGWDGSFKGIIQPAGSYIYIMQYTTLDNELKQEQGIFTLIK